jgi:hypothetical protein
MGTPVYMSPSRPSRRRSTPAPDRDTWGIILFELLTGDCPFRGGMITVLRRHLMDQPPPLPSGILEQWDPRMAEIVRKLLEKDPGKRFQTAAELTAALDEVAVALERKTVAGQPRTTGPPREARGPSVFFNERVLPCVRWCLPIDGSEGDAPACRDRTLSVLWFDRRGVDAPLLRHLRCDRRAISLWRITGRCLRLQAVVRVNPLGLRPLLLSRRLKSQDVSRVPS